MRGGIGDALTGVAAIFLATVIFWTMRALGYKPTRNDFGYYTGLSVGLIIGGFALYAILAVIVSLVFGVWLWPFGPGNSN